MPKPHLLKRMWAAFVAGFRSYPAEIDGCRNCKHARWFDDGQGRCKVNGSRAKAFGYDIYEALPYRAEECDAWERKEGETRCE